MGKIKESFYIGDKKIGDGNILLQGMVKGDLKNINSIFNEIDLMIDEGADLIRVAVPDKKSIEYIEKIVKYSKVPIISDIHFNPELAILSIEAGVKKIRLNPSNIKKKEDIKRIVEFAKSKDVPIRVGGNIGSIYYEKKYKFNLKDLIQSVKNEVRLIEEFGYKKIVISCKSDNPLDTIKIYKNLSKIFPYPLHLGVTATGSDEDGIIKSVIGIGNLLLDGIGDTIRVSLSGESFFEVRIGRKILENLNLRKRDRIEIISCPKCSRCNKNFEKILNEVKENFKDLKVPVKLAIMGCEVNAIGESQNADLGIAMTRGKILFFEKGKMVKYLNEEEIIPFLKKVLKGETIYVSK